MIDSNIKTLTSALENMFLPSPLTDSAKSQELTNEEWKNSFKLENETVILPQDIVFKATSRAVAEPHALQKIFIKST